MKAKTLVYALLALILATLPLAEAQQPKKVPRIGYLSTRSPGSPSTIRGRFNMLRKTLEELGWVEGQNVTIEYRYSKGKLDNLPELAVALVRLKVDIIVVDNQVTTRAAMNVTKTIPIVMTGIGVDPVDVGLVVSLARPGGNVTGLTAIHQDLSGKRLQLLKEAFPRVSRVAILWNPEAPGSAHGFKETRVAAQPVRLQLQSVEIRDDLNDIDKAFSALAKNRVDALFVVPDPVVNLHRKKITDLAAKSNLPAMYSDVRFIEEGGLMSYGPNFDHLSRRAAYFVDKILRGTNPADLPVERPTKLELVINLKTAKQIGVMIPPEVLQRADKVIR
jgi:putative tryptophan/tyrosine transport system substrate-binding protein